MKNTNRCCGLDSQSHDTKEILKQVRNDEVAFFVSEDCAPDIWDNFVEKHPQGSVFQSRAYFNAHVGRQKTDAIAFFVFAGKGELVAVLVAVLHKSCWGLGNRTVIQSAPLLKTENPHALALLLQKYTKKIANRAVYTQVRNAWETEKNRSVFIENRFRFESHLNIIINLEKTLSQLWEEVHTHRRRNIRKAEKSLIFRQLTVDDFEKSYQILQQNYRRYRLPLLQKQIFEKLFIEEKMLIFGVSLNEKLIGALYALANNSSLYCWYACSFREYNKLYPNDLLYWKVISWAQEHGFREFDFGGAGKPEEKYGVRDFKMQFGGNVTNFGRYVQIHKAIIFNLAKFVFKIFSK
ncbi:MAG: GNAT family N-acetyltransferase [Prevotellaceae bacterium]|jgi:lipid II:glycine glycyltransferase (peptidoglycan interpeptide bridge formation enzyme)|nr:GNAT family N-acetyltransferase [Prevotellaceae bacterium]